MGSMATEDVTSSSAVVPKIEPIQDGYTPSSASSPDDQEASVSAEPGPIDPPPVPKRKGGRKPIYATSEERKQRNRQAQAAFRERRTEYIKQLETTIQHHEETLQTLQQSHRTAADECLMLRYKNSLLERILLEKGIDVQAELRLKGSPHLRPVRQGGMTSQASPMQKAILSRQQQARQRPVVQPAMQTVNTSPQSFGTGNFAASPTTQPTPTSQQSSPAALRSPGFSLQGGMQSPSSDIQMHRPQHNQQPSQRPPSQLQSHPYAAQPRGHLRTSSSSGSSHAFNAVPRQPTSAGVMQQDYYPTPFQKHYDQLDQEFDTQGELLDGDDGDDVDADSYIPNFRLPPTNGHPPMNMQISPPTTTSGISDAGGGTTALPFDYDPMLDADPFGLTASMHFPNPFNFPMNQPRR